MRLFTKITLMWDGEKYVTDLTRSTWEEYSGAFVLCCGATSGQQQIGQQQSAFYQTMQNQMQQVFGSASQVFNDLMSSFSPIFAAGPNQQGFSAQELSNLNSGAIDQVGASYKNAKQAVGETIAAQGGGNMALPSGAAIGPQVQLAASAANQTASELQQVKEADYATGRQNWLAAAQGLEGSTNVFNPAVGFANAANNAGEAAANTQNQIAQENNGWVNGVLGILGGVAGAATGGLMKNIGTQGESGSNTGPAPGDPGNGIDWGSDGYGNQ